MTPRPSGTAVVVGSGPNGLTAAVTLAAAGLEVVVLEAADEVGGGLRSAEVTLPGLVHDECAGFHPFTAGSGFVRHFGLPGVRWAWPDVQHAHPLDDGRGAHAVRSVAETAAGLGRRDGAAYRRLVGDAVVQADDLFEEILRPALHVPRHPLRLARFGALAALPASVLARSFAEDPARGLWAGLAAHAFRPLTAPFSSAAGLALGVAAHAHGWPVAVGGSRAIARSLLDLLASFDGRVETGVRVESLPDADLVLLDVAPTAAADLLGRRAAQSYRRYRSGPAAFQVSLAVDGGVPWSYEPARRAGTVHVGGRFEEVAAAERDVVRGTMPARPFLLVGQQYLADPSRSSGEVHPVDAYAHVPAGYAGDATAAILGQLERFAPGVRSRIRAFHVRSPAQIEADDANFVGGDIATGAAGPGRLLLGPRPGRDPYATGVPGVYLCSAATPPGPGAHGICGHLAAQRALAGGRR